MLRDNRNWHTAFLVGLVASMSFQGIANIKQQRSIIGKFIFVIVRSELVPAYFLRFVRIVENKIFGSGGIRTHAPEEIGALN